jgi:hypothetical protein
VSRSFNGPFINDPFKGLCLTFHEETTKGSELRTTWDGVNCWTESPCRRYKTTGEEGDIRNSNAGVPLLYALEPMRLRPANSIEIVPSLVTSANASSLLDALFVVDLEHSSFSVLGT